MHKLETLPKSVLCNDIPYSLSVHVTAWNKLCVCYKKMFPSKELKDSFKETIFSQVVEPQMITNPEYSECEYDIVDCPNFESAVDMLECRLNDGLKTSVVEIYKD